MPPSPTGVHAHRPSASLSGVRASPPWDMSAPTSEDGASRDASTESDETASADGGSRNASAIESNGTLSAGGSSRDASSESDPDPSAARSKKFPASLDTPPSGWVGGSSEHAARKEMHDAHPARMRREARRRSIVYLFSRLAPARSRCNRSATRPSTDDCPGGAFPRRFALSSERYANSGAEKGHPTVFARLFRARRWRPRPSSFPIAFAKRVGIVSHT